MHPANLALRFVLELVMLWAWVELGLHLAGWWLGVALVVGAASMWVVFNVKGDPSRSGKAPVEVPGALRLALELGLFGGGVAGLAVARGWIAAAVFGAALVVHHAASTTRIRWLLER